MKKILLLSVFLFAFIFNIQSQNWVWTLTEVANMPMPISNNAVVEGWTNDTGYVYSFGGIDNTKIWSGINKKSFRYNTITDVWDTIPDLPNTNAVIAAGASYVDSIVYIMGGYQVLSNGNEISSNIVNRFNPRTNTYLSNGANIPVATDDHVQAVYKDSLIYVITGWNNNGNIPNVQIYDPANDNWLTGTSVPNNNTYKAFGASGTIINNTIYYHGGASTATNFPAQSTLRIGQIDLSDPTQITWTSQSSLYNSYRGISVPYSKNGSGNNPPNFFGGSSTSYNYNGIAYNGSGGVAPNNRGIFYNLSSTNIDTIINFQSNSGAKLPMDMRGVAYIDYNMQFFDKGWFIAGGMEDNQKVSNKTFKLSYIALVSVNEESNNSMSFQLYPNPTSEKVNLIFKDKEDRTITLINVIGKEVLRIDNGKLNLQLDVSNYPKGIYFVKVEAEGKSNSQKIILQ
ncbi:MAG: T9SS type A sorting domain-containing protein [Vicingaceae bacterium]|nr:T9SS type A sorting domain-containing protein [Vicingaceae bacterium]